MFSMATHDDKGCSSAKKMKLDTPTEYDTVQSLNAQFPKIDNLEYFPEKVLFHIFSKVNDKDLLHLSDTSCRFESIARIVFKDKYADKHFVFDGERQREMYEELFNRFGRYADIKYIEVKNIADITENHWLPQLLRQHTNRLQKLAFIDCSFKRIRKFLSEHMSVDHLVLRCVETNVEFLLPNYLNLKKLELKTDSYNFVNLTKNIRNNPTLESLVLKCRSGEFTLHNMMKMIAQNSMNLQHLTELHLDFDVDDSRISADNMDSIIDALKNLQSLKLNITNDQLELIQRLGLACKQLKHLPLEYYEEDDDFSDAMFDALGQFTTIEQFELKQRRYNDRIETVVGHMPNVSQLDLRMKIPNSSTFILSLLRNCPSIEAITIDTGTDIKPQFFVDAQFWDEFTEAMQQPNGKVELKMNRELICYVTKKEIVWNNTVMHWHEWNCNETNVTLLDLAKPSATSVAKEAEQEKPSPFDHILGYLDLASMHSMAAASEYSKQLVESYVKRHAQRNGTFTISDQFHHDAEGLDAFAEHVENLEVEIFDPDFFDHLNATAKHFTKLSKLLVRSKQVSGPILYESRCVFPQVCHLIVDKIPPDLCTIFKCYPKLETLKLENDDFFLSRCSEPLATCNLKKFSFEYGDESELEKVRKMFERTSTELIPIHKEGTKTIRA